MKRFSAAGFTLIEVIVVLGVMALLAVVTSIEYVNIQQRGRDAERKNDTMLVADALEKYFAKNGEYPRYFDLRDNGPSVLGIDKELFISPSDDATTGGVNGQGTSIVPLTWGPSGTDDMKRYSYWVPGENAYTADFSPPNITDTRNTFVLSYLREEGAYGDTGTRITLCGKGLNINTSKTILNTANVALSKYGFTSASCSNF